MNQSLSTNQKGSTGVLLLWTFLEYFDLMLYVHMSVVINELFFPQTDPSVRKIPTALTFCLTYLLRPIGLQLAG